MALVLIAEDERDLAESLELFLRSNGHLTERAHDGEAALTLFRAARPDIVLLDVMMPKRDGFAVLEVIRRESDTPVIMLTARTEEVDKLYGLGLGADDYLSKPYSLREVAARIRTVLRRAQGREITSSQIIRLGDLEIDTYSVSARVSGERLDLTPTEFKLLHHLALTPGRAVSRAELLEHTLPESDALESAIVVHLNNLRNKLGRYGADHLLVTVRGVGYRLS